MSIRVSEVTKVYGTQVVLDHVSFNIEKGEVVGLLGPNGAGKSTLMKIITCFIPPTSGEAFVNGMEVSQHALEIKKHVGYLPENNPLYTEMYIKEYLEFIAGIHLPHKAIRKRIGEIIDITGLGPEQHKKIGTLSKGYRQRVGLAQALIHDPDVLILDEPTSGLDPNQLLEIRNLIREIGREKTVMLSTHIMQEVEAVCDRAIIIHLGKLVADDATSKLTMLKGREMITVEFSEAVKGGLLEKLKGVVTAKQVNKTTWKLEADPGTDIRPEINRFAVDHNLAILSLQKEEQKLEEVFQLLTRK
jgi:ABC-2 type transport system ATP-binding protein